MKKPIILTLVVALVMGGAAFFGGVKYQQSKTPGFRGLNGQFNPTARTTRTNQNFSSIRGEVLNQDGSSITVKLPDNSSKLVLLTGSTTISEATMSSIQNLTSGKQVMVMGTANSDGSVTASNIQLNPTELGRSNGQ